MAVNNRRQARDAELITYSPIAYCLRLIAIIERLKGKFEKPPKPGAS